MNILISEAILPYIDFVNIMSYDMGNAPKHHSALYSSDNSGRMTGDKAVKAHLAAGVPADKLVMGMPFSMVAVERNIPIFKTSTRWDMPKGFRECWDETALAPYLVNKNDTLVFGYENPRSLAIKCQYILKAKPVGRYVLGL